MQPNWFINQKTKGQTAPLRIASNNKTYTNKADIADQFNRHVINVGPLLANKITMKTLRSISHHLQPIALLCPLSLKLRFLSYLKP